MEWELGMGGYCRVTFSSKKQAFQVPTALLRRIHMNMGVCACVAISVYLCVSVSICIPVLPALHLIKHFETRITIPTEM